VSNKRITNMAELEALARKEKPVIDERVSVHAAEKNVRRHVLICHGGGCIASGALDFKAALEKEIKAAGLGKTVSVYATGCLGPCAVGPVAVVYPEGTFYQNLKAADAKQIVKDHLKNGKIVDRLVNKKALTGVSVPEMTKIDFLARQTKVVLRNCGVIDPLSIDEYIGRDGYMALAKVLNNMKPDDVIDIVKKSGIRGRGGAGYGGKPNGTRPVNT